MKKINIKKINSGINSKALKLTFNKKNYFIKLYKNKTSFYKDIIFYLSLLQKRVRIPKIIKIDYKNLSIVLQFISGKKIKTITRKNLNEIFLFLKKIQKAKSRYIINSKKIKSNFMYAKDYSLNLKEMKISLEYRIKKILKIKLTNKKIYLEVLNLKKIIKLINNDFKKLNSKIDYPNILSPSDFGINNMILTKDDKIYFIDFEYGGIDSPIKLKYDFLLNPNHKFSMDNIEYFNKKFNKIFKTKLDSKVENFLKKLFIVKWMLIILSAYLKKNNKIYLKNYEIYKKRYIEYLY